MKCMRVFRVLPVAACTSQDALPTDCVRTRPQPVVHMQPHSLQTVPEAQVQPAVTQLRARPCHPPPPATSTPRGGSVSLYAFHRLRGVPRVYVTLWCGCGLKGLHYGTFTRVFSLLARKTMPFCSATRVMRCACSPFKPLLGFVLFVMKRVQKATWASKSYTSLGYL